MSKHDEWVERNAIKLYDAAISGTSAKPDFYIKAGKATKYLNTLHTYDPETHVPVPILTLKNASIGLRAHVADDYHAEHYRGLANQLDQLMIKAGEDK